MSRSPTAVARPHCTECGASWRIGADCCWLCGAVPSSSAASAAAVPMVEAARPAPLERIGSYSLASLMMFITLASVVLGVSTIAPGIGIPLGIVFTVVWLRTTAVARRRAAHGLPVTRTERVQLFLASLGASAVLIALTCAAGCAAYFAACFACMGTYFGLQGAFGENAAAAFGYIVYGIVALVIVGPTLWAVTRVIKRRWRRDISEQSSPLKEKPNVENKP